MDSRGPVAAGGRGTERTVREIEGRPYPGVLNGQTTEPAAFVGQLGHHLPDGPPRVRGEPRARHRESDRQARAERGECRGRARLAVGAPAAEGMAEQPDRAAPADRASPRDT